MPRWREIETSGEEVAAATATFPELGARVAHLLWLLGYHQRDQLREVTDQELTMLRGLSPAMLLLIRQHFPYVKR